MTRTAALAAAIFALVLATRIPFAAEPLWAHDSALYAAALERGFHVDDDLSQQRPHPPGYLFYVAVAALARLGGAGSNDSLVLVSAVASALAAAALFLFARRWMRDGVAVVTALAFAANPLVWQYSEIAFPYTTLALGSILVAAACLAARGRDLRAAMAAGAVLGIASGFRQDLLLLRGPLWIWTVSPLGPRRAAIASAGVACASLAWVVPSVALSGGPRDYLDALLTQTAYVRATYSVEMRGLPALAANAAATSWALVWGLSTVGPFGVAGIAAAMRRHVDERSRALLVWTLPPLGVYVALHIGDWGYVLSILPGAFIAAGRALDAAIRWLEVRASNARTHPFGVPTSALGGATALFVAVPGLAFAFAPLPFSASAIAEHDTALAQRVAFVRVQFDPRTTLILTREDFLLVRYYLPEFRSRQHDPEPYTRAARRMRVGHVERIVVFTPGLVPEQKPDVRSARCGKGIELVYLEVQPGAVLEFRGERYAIASPAP